MTKYIDADRLKAEIERKIHEISHPLKDGYEVQSIGKIEGLSELLEIIDSLQQDQPEVDLEKEIEMFGTDERPTKDDLISFARHFYELGLNTRKED